jgi:hypothetical protein
MVSSLALEHVLKPSNFGSRSGYRPIDIHLLDISIKSKLYVSASSDQLYTNFNLRVILIRCCTRLMMCLIHIDEFIIHVSIAAQLSCLCLPFSEILNSLLDRLNNRRMMHDF